MQFLALVVFTLQLFLGTSLPSDELHLSLATEALVAGSYTSAFGSGIVFVIESSGFHITDQDLNTIVSVDALGKNRQLIEIKRNNFLQEKNEPDTSDYYITPEEVQSLKAAYNRKDLAKVDELVSQAKRLNRIVVNSKLQHSLSSLLADPCSELLVSTATAMGNTGLTAMDHPLLLPFYATAMRLGKLMNNTGSERKRQVCNSFDTCPPCEENGCLGMCGLGCSCWSFVCGDCCYHQGCYEHDLCCESYFTLSCLFPFSFSCNSYSC